MSQTVHAPYHATDSCMDQLLQPCTSLASLTLTLTLTPGEFAATKAQLGIIHSIAMSTPCDSIRRVQLCIIIAEKKGTDSDVEEQAKRIEWRAAESVLARFANLREFVVVVREKGGCGESEIWRNIEVELRKVIGKKVRLTCRQDCLV